MKISRVILKPEKEKPLKAFHPWVFSGAIDEVDDDFKSADLVRVYSSSQEFLGIGYLNPNSQIAVRILSFRDQEIDTDFFIDRMTQAKKLREAFISADTNAYRLVHAEGDFLPGLVLDRYADFVVAQFTTAGMEKLKPAVLDAINQVFPSKGIYEHDDESMRKKEGLETGLTVLRGEEPPDYVEILEYGHKFIVDIKKGQKTGFFLDQRENRKLVAGHVRGKRVLNCFAYTGGFSVYAAKAGAASVTSVEIQDRAINTMKTNFELNDLPIIHRKGDRHMSQDDQLPVPFSIGTNGTGEGIYRFIKEDVFDFLRTDMNVYDFIILDPPAFCKNQNQIQQAARGYKDINLQAMKRLAPDGLLFTFSCSSYIDPDLFQKIIFGAAKDVQRNVQIIQKISHAFDHPINIYHPEGEYLKGLLLRVM